MAKAVHVADSVGETLSIFGGTIQVTLKIMGAETGGAFAVFEDLVAPGGGPARHIHPDQEELFSVISGRFAFEIDGTRIEAGPGDLALVPRGAVHAFKNLGDAPARLRYILTPAGRAEDMFRALYAADQRGELTRETIPAITEGMGVVFVGAPL